MPKPFSCPHCAGHDYVVVLTGCKIADATVEEGFTWDPAEEEYVSSGSVVMDSDSFENEAGHVICSNCENDVTEAYSVYETTLAAQAGAAEA